MARRQVNVSAHYKPSLGKVVGPYQQERQTTAAPADRQAAAGALADLAGGKRQASKLVFPAPEHKPPRRSWWRRQREARTPTVERFETLGDYAPLRRWTYRDINGRGEGALHSYETMRVGRRSKKDCFEQKVGPNQTIDNPLFLDGRDYSNTNMPELTVLGRVDGSSWAGADLRGATFGSETEADPTTILNGANFNGADLAGSRFVRTRMSDVSMRGANVTDVMFDVRYWHPGGGQEQCFIDVTDSNVTAEQFDALAGAVRGYGFLNGTEEKIRINRHTLDEAAALTGEDPEALVVLLWAGDVETRERGTDQPVEAGSFDAEKHYIPQWEVQRLLQSAP